MDAPPDTARLRFRPLCEEDLPWVLELWTHPLVSQWIGIYTPAKAEAELAFQISQQQRAGWSYWALEERAGGRMIGGCGLQPMELSGPEVELCYDLHPDTWGAGRASEAAKAVVEFAFSELGMERIVAVVLALNVASRCVLENAGLVPAGERLAYGQQMLQYEATRYVRSA